MSRSTGGRPPGMMAVARLAGVSHQTVSRVLNHPDAVRPETRARVQAAMDELGYSRNLAARALVTRQTGLIGVVWTGAGYFGPSSTVAGIEVAARSAGYSTLVGALGADTATEMADVVRSFRDRGVEGIIVVAPHDQMAGLARDHALGIPTVLVADVDGEPGMHAVSVDQREGARLAVQLLVDRGCRSILHVSGPLDWFDARARIDGWRSTLVANSLDVPQVVVGDWEADRGYALAERLADSRELPDAIFCGNDALALGMLAGFRDRGVAVPQQVSLVGFDDVDGAAFFAPPLTTIRQPFTELGGACVEVLMRAIGGAEPSVTKLPPELVLRRSTR